MTTPEHQPAPAVQPAQIIDLCDRSLGMVGLASCSDLVARVEDLERMAALRYAQVYALTVDLTAVATDVYRNTEASLDEAAERAASAAKRGGSFLQQAHAHPDLSNPPANVVLLAAHRIQVVGGRL